MTYAGITRSIDSSMDLRYTPLITSCFDLALDGPLTIEPWVLEMQGMSGKRYRQMINLIISTLPDARYLEVGTWLGSTLCSAVSGNTVSATAIDMWGVFPGSIDTLHANIQRAQNGRNPVTFLQEDFSKVDFSGIGRFNAYMFDGPHSEQDQYDGIVIAMPALDDEFVLIVDDYNSFDVQSGTQRAIQDLGLIVDSIEIFTTLDGSHPPNAHQNSDWHNGYFIASVRKPG
jgi:hypothetical protein